MAPSSYRPDQLRFLNEAGCHRLIARALDLMDRPYSQTASVPVSGMLRHPLVPPEAFGRYLRVSELGQGAFGRVFLADDPLLQRRVAIKWIERTSGGDDRILSEARAIAQLNHRNIVPVFDTGRTPGGQVFLVLELIEGKSLAEILRQTTIPARRAVELVTAIAEAIAVAHQAGLVHRDLKPANILIDNQGQPRITDFGLAQHIDSNHSVREIAGTPGYMAPEQLRGESHRIDARTDLWALGALFFEILTGEFLVAPDVQKSQVRRPETITDIQLASDDPRIQTDLIRMINRLVAGPQGARYQSAFELLEDLRAWHESLLPELPVQSSRKLIPKGLRGYDEQDHDFYLQLVAGPRDRHGLPESIRFWKTRVETRDPATLFMVGVCYGASGCGKTSLIRAGLIPSLAESVSVVYVSATATQTEQLLLTRIRRVYPQLPAELSLVESVIWLRQRNERHPHAKTLLVIDQFEQWLERSGTQWSGSLIDALRQCDGFVSCLLLVRDDYWLPLTRCMQRLEIPLQQGRNIAVLEPFDVTHAVNVLRAYGVAWSRISDGRMRHDSQLSLFLQRAVDELAVDGRVNCAQLAFLAESLRATHWSLETLRKSRGVEGVMENHVSRLLWQGPKLPLTATEAAVALIFECMLPPAGMSIRSRPRSNVELRQVCGDTTHDSDFSRLLGWLENEVHFITRLESAGVDVEQGLIPLTYYELTHDCLVPILRRWLDRRRRGTLSGRAQLLLEERTRWWQEDTHRRTLPTVLEWVKIRAFTSPVGRTDSQRRLLRATDRFYLQWIGGSLIAIGLIVWGLVESVQSLRASSHIDRLLAADINELPTILEQGRPLHARVNRSLASLSESDASPARQLKLQLQLLTTAPDGVAELLEKLPELSPAEVAVAGQIARTYCSVPQLSAALTKVWARALAADTELSDRLRYAAMLSTVDPDNVQWNTLSDRWVAGLVAEPIHLIPEWMRLLAPVSWRGRTELQSLLKRRPLDSHRTVALTAYLGFEYRHPDQLIAIVPDLTSQELRSVASVLIEQQDRAHPLLSKTIQQKLADLSALAAPAQRAEETIADLRAREVANLILVQTLIGDSRTFLKCLEHSEVPRLRTWLIHDALAAQVAASTLWSELARFETLSPGTIAGLVIALGGSPSHSEPAQPDASQLRLLWRLFQSHPDSGVHSAVEWLLISTGQRSEVQALKQKLASWTPVEDRRWYVLPHGITMAVIEPGEFEMGTLKWVDAFYQRPRHTRVIPRRFAISTTKVTQQQFASVMNSSADKPGQITPGQITPGQIKPGQIQTDQIKTEGADNLPVNQIPHDQMHQFCLELSRQANLLPDQYCYVEPTPGEENQTRKLKLTPNPVHRRGFRFPTEGEFEYCARAGTKTFRSYGFAPELLTCYASYADNSQGTLQAVERRCPNAWGLFDTIGNLFEPCLDTRFATPALSGMTHVPVTEGPVIDEPVVDGDDVILRGTLSTMPQDVTDPAYRIQGSAYASSLTGFRIVQTLP